MSKNSAEADNQASSSEDKSAPALSDQERSQVTAFYHRHHKHVLAVAKRFLDSIDDAEDVAQEVFHIALVDYFRSHPQASPLPDVIASSSAPDLDPPPEKALSLADCDDTTATRWLTRVTMYSSLNIRKGAHRSKRVDIDRGAECLAFDPAIDRILHIPLTPEENILIKERQEHAQASLDGVQSLTRRQQEAFQLATIKGLAYAEIAECMGISFASAKGLVARARKATRLSDEQRRALAASVLVLGTGIVAPRTAKAEALRWFRSWSRFGWALALTAAFIVTTMGGVAYTLLHRATETPLPERSPVARERTTEDTRGSTSMTETDASAAPSSTARRDLSDGGTLDSTRPSSQTFGDIPPEWAEASWAGINQTWLTVHTRETRNRLGGSDDRVRIRVDEDDRIALYRVESDREVEVCHGLRSGIEFAMRCANIDRSRPELYQYDYLLVGWLDPAGLLGNLWWMWVDVPATPVRAAIRSVSPVIPGGTIWLSETDPPFEDLRALTAWWHDLHASQVLTRMCRRHPSNAICDRPYRELAMTIRRNGDACVLGASVESRPGDSEPTLEITTGSLNESGQAYSVLGGRVGTTLSVTATSPSEFREYSAHAWSDSTWVVQNDYNLRCGGGRAGHEPLYGPGMSDCRLETDRGATYRACRQSYQLGTRSVSLGAFRTAFPPGQAVPIWAIQPVRDW
ncbi:MAG: sigma-70 family RNA polymerase sigma factor [Deltaproteobacteria bacterium]|nr:sigma-70 family RNA polymerase sigma factor [Deltaproteobacteria bacterium]